MLKVYNKMGKLLSTIITFLIAMIGWIFFKVEKLSDAFVYLRNLFRFNFSNSHLNSFTPEFYTFLIIATLFAFFAYFKKGQNIQDAVYFNEYSNQKHTWLTILSILLLVLSVSFIASNGFNPFIYFRF